MADLYRKPTEESLEFARKPLVSINPDRVKAYKQRYRNIEKVYDDQIKGALKGTRDHHNAASIALDNDKERKLGQLQAEFQAMLDPRLFAEAKRMFEEFADTSPFKAFNYGSEALGYAQTGLSLGTGAVAMGLQVGATGLLLSNPFTASLAVLNELDKWLGRAIGWVQMAKKQWDADCGRISKRCAAAIAKAYGDSKLSGATSGGTFSVGAKDSTLQRQKMEKLLYHRILEIREEMIKYKIRECEVTAQAEGLREQKKPIEAQVHALDKQVKAMEHMLQTLPPNAHFKEGSKKVLVKDRHAAVKKQVEKLTQQCMELSQKMADLLNEVVDNCSRLINKQQTDVDKMIKDVQASFLITEAKGKFTGAHTSGAWLKAIRDAL